MPFKTFLILIFTFNFTGAQTPPPAMPADPPVQATTPPADKPPVPAVTSPPPPSQPAPELQQPPAAANPDPQMQNTAQPANNSSIPAGSQSMKPAPMGSANAGSIIASEIIFIKPYFKNKPQLGRMTAELYHVATNVLVGTVTSNFGDCSNSCARGASVKSKIGIRFYGDSIGKLRVSRKSSTSIKIKNCPASLDVADAFYTCEFSHKSQDYKMTVRITP